ncbi:hypothetical protein D3C81_1681140 [compost metagenome]
MALHKLEHLTNFLHIYFNPFAAKKNEWQLRRRQLGQFFPGQFAVAKQRLRFKSDQLVHAQLRHSRRPSIRQSTRKTLGFDTNAGGTTPLSGPAAWHLHGYSVLSQRRYRLA